MKRDHLESDVVIRVVAGHVDQCRVARLARSQTKRQQVVPGIHSFHLVHRVRQYSTSTPAVFQAGDVIAELVRHAVCVGNIRDASVVSFVKRFKTKVLLLDRPKSSAS